jgi:hypothetical protein
MLGSLFYPIPRKMVGQGWLGISVLVNWSMLSVRASSLNLMMFWSLIDTGSYRAGIVADDANQEVLFHTAPYRDLTSSSVTSFGDTHTPDPFDFSVYMDQVSLITTSLLLTHIDNNSQAPLTIQSNSPLELVHQFFAKLGARYVVVTDTDGDCK